MSTPNANGTNSHPGNGQLKDGQGQYVIDEAPGMYSRPLRVVCIGSGFSGVYFGIAFQMSAPFIDLCIYEKNPDVGGTWYENRYPGAACDVPAHRYCYSFEPNPHWSNFYSPAEEIQQYIANTAKKYDVMKYIKLQHKVSGARWDEGSGKWKLQVAAPDGTIFNDTCDVLINAMGVLNNWRWPNIDGLDTFKGLKVHSANYDRSLDLSNKRVAVIGSGSSAIQILPTIRPNVKRLGAYLRSNTWIVPPFGSQYIKKDENGELILEYSEEERKKFAEDPEAFLDYRRLLEKDISSRFRMYMRDNPQQSAVRPQLEKYMRQRLAKKPEIADHLIPNWPVGCRRITPGIGYLEALCEDNVDVFFSDIDSITDTGIKTADGNHVEYDAIICATGFDVSYSARFPLEGRNGAKLDEEFSENPYSYIAIAEPGFPNYFTFCGPNAPVGVGSLVPAVEAQGDYMLKAINKIATQKIKSMEPSKGSVNDFVKHTDTWMPRSVWSAGCRSWYKNGKIDGRVTALWPGSGLHYIDSLSDPRWEDYEYTYLDPTNRFAYLGDGFTQLEWEEGDRTATLPERTNRMRNHPALRKEESTKENKFKGVSAVDTILGNGK